MSIIANDPSTRMTSDPPKFGLRLFSDVPPDEFSSRNPKHLLSVIHGIDLSGHSDQQPDLHECSAKVVWTLARKRGSAACSSAYPRALLALVADFVAERDQSKAAWPSIERDWLRRHVESQMRGTDAPDPILSALREAATLARERLASFDAVALSSVDLFLKPCLHYANNLAHIRLGDSDMPMHERFQERIEDLCAIEATFSLSAYHPHVNATATLHRINSEAVAVHDYLRGLLARIDTGEYTSEEAFVKETDDLFRHYKGFSMDHIAAPTEEDSAAFDLYPGLWLPSIKGLPYIRQLPTDEFPPFPRMSVGRAYTQEEVKLDLDIDKCSLADTRSCLSRMSRAFTRYAAFLVETHGHMMAQDESLVQRSNLPAHITSMVELGHQYVDDSRRVESNFATAEERYAKILAPDQSRLFHMIKHHSLKALGRDRLALLHGLSSIHSLLQSNATSPLAVRRRESIDEIVTELEALEKKTARAVNRLKGFSGHELEALKATTIGTLKSGVGDTQSKTDQEKSAAETKTSESLSQGTQTDPQKLGYSDVVRMFSIHPKDPGSMVETRSDRPWVKWTHDGPAIVSSEPRGNGGNVVLDTGDTYWGR